MVQRVFLMLALALPWAAPAAAAEDDGETLWRETTRDVYVDGRLDPHAIVLRTAKPPRLALLRDRNDTSPTVVDMESLELQRLAVDDLTFGERGWEARTKGQPRPLARGTASRIDDSTLLLVLRDGYFIVAPHAGGSGSTSPDQIFRRVPSWKKLYERYEPDEDTTRRLGAIDESVQLTLALGTWCGDSKRAVPRLLKTLDRAANPHIQLELIALSGDFDEPGDLIRSRKLTNVPTLLVSKGGEEVGRIVETPSGDSMAADLARILSREPVLNEGRWARTERLARGRYAFLDASGVERGFEDWEMYSDAEGGTLLHAWTDRSGKTAEVWHRRDADGRSSFVEITRADNPWHSRSRHWITASTDPKQPGRKLRVLTRGNGTGVIRQNAVLDDGTVMVSPCVADTGRASVRLASSQGPTARSAMLLGGTGESATPRLGRLKLGYRGVEPITTEAGTFHADRVAGRFDGAFVDGWLHAELGVPVRWRRVGADEVVLTRLERFDDGESGVAAGQPVAEQR